VSERKQRRQLRYWFYRIKTELDGGVPAEEPRGLRQEFESKVGFGGWTEFAKSWDVSEGAPWEIVRRKYSEEELWNWTLLAESRELRKA
jgi:hypothetical protein